MFIVRVKNAKGPVSEGDILAQHESEKKTRECGLAAHNAKMSVETELGFLS